MPELVANCPRCGAKEMTFDVLCCLPIVLPGAQMGCEAYSSCKRCLKGTIFILRPKMGCARQGWCERLRTLGSALNTIASVSDHVSLKDEACGEVPKHLPENIEAAFREGATCVAVGCYNAACCMFRLCIDLATKPRLPEEGIEGLKAKTRRDLGLRLPWLFDNGLLPEDLRELSLCIKDYGDDGAHYGVVAKVDADDILDFTFALLKRLFTEPKEVELARERQRERRKAARG